MAALDRKEIAVGFGLCLLYIIISAGLIHFNKFLVSKARFPHAMVLTTFHMGATTILANLLYLVRPQLFTTMEQTKGKRLQLLKYFVPLGILFAVGLFCSNQAYMWCSAAFLQFMKEANLVLVFILSCLAGLSAWSRPKTLNIVWIICGASLAVAGEVHFAMIGFVFQAISQVGECSKNVLGDWIMNGSDFKLDPLTYTMFMAPVCLVVLCIGSAVTWQESIVPDVIKYYPLLIPNACLAFFLNVTIAVLIKRCSAMAFILAGIVKDVVIVVVSNLMFHESVVRQQYVGFAVCLSGVFFWSFCRIMPDSLPVVLFHRLCQVDTKPNPETQPLLADKSKEKV